MLLMVGTIAVVISVYQLGLRDEGEPARQQLDLPDPLYGRLRRLPRRRHLQSLRLVRGHAHRLVRHDGVGRRPRPPRRLAEIRHAQPGRLRPVSRRGRPRLCPLRNPQHGRSRPAANQEDAPILKGRLLALLFLASFGIKSAMFPFFFWLPDSYPTTPAVVGALFAALLTKVGVYALLRVFTLVFPGEIESLRPVLLILAAFTMVLGVLGAMAQEEIRRILSFHIISQIGYMIMGLAFFTPLAIAGTIYFILHNIIAKTNLFLIGGWSRISPAPPNSIASAAFSTASPSSAASFSPPRFPSPASRRWPASGPSWPSSSPASAPVNPRSSALLSSSAC
jgi:hypothetical protein